MEMDSGDAISPLACRTAETKTFLKSLRDAVVSTSVSSTLRLRDSMILALERDFDADVTAPLISELSKRAHDPATTLGACLFLLGCPFPLFGFELPPGFRASLETISLGFAETKMGVLDWMVFAARARTLYALHFGMCAIPDELVELEQRRTRVSPDAVECYRRPYAGAGARYGKKDAEAFLPLAKPPGGFGDTNVFVVNFVATFHVGCDVVVRDLIRKCPSMFVHALQGEKCKFTRPLGTCMIYASGKAVVVGARFESHAALIAWRTALLLRENGYPLATVAQFKKDNITSTFSLWGAFNLIKYSEDNPNIKETKFEIDSFPGIQIKCPEYGTTFLVFTQGSVIVIGCRAISTALASVRFMFRKFAPYVKTDREGIFECFALADALRHKHPSRKEVVRDMVEAAEDDESDEELWLADL